MQPLLSAQNLVVKLDGRVILESVSLIIAKGELTTLIGPNGAGKSTLVKVLLGLHPHSEGTLQKSPDLVLGYVPQRFVVDPVLPVTVSRFLKLNFTDQARVAEVVAEIGLKHLLAVQLSALSGGELQRVLLARSLLRKPNVLILDEPMQGIDVAGQGEFYELLDNIRSKHDMGILMVSHDLHWVFSRTDKVICLNQHICCEGHPDDVSKTAAFMTLFGTERKTPFALYTHHHNHHHGLHGEVINDKTEE